MAETMSRELVALCGQLEPWRKYGGGGRGKRIPKAMWQQTAAVARVDGVQATARAARLSVERLQACVAAGEVPHVHVPRDTAPRRSVRQSEDALARSHAQSRGPQFVSVQLAPSVRRPALTIELIGRSGERMRIESAEGLDLADVVHGFWTRRS